MLPFCAARRCGSASASAAADLPCFTTTLLFEQDFASQFQIITDVSRSLSVKNSENQTSISNGMSV
jgi:hypothetical protein